MAGSSTRTFFGVSETARHVLILGGTGEASALARELTARNYEVVLSLKGLTDTGQQPFPVRVGRFGGIVGLANELRSAGYRLLIDASHPFAIRLSQNAAAAAKVAEIPRLRLLRPPWQPMPSDRWFEVGSLPEAVVQVDSLKARRVFLSVGRLGAGAFADLRDVHFVMRSISPVPSPPIAATVVVDRAPFTRDGELALFREHRVDLLVTRNSGGSATAAKLFAARCLGIPVVMVRRPSQPPGDRADDVDGALAWTEEHSR